VNSNDATQIQRLALRQRQVAELVRCYRRELASWQAQLLHHSALLVIDCTCRDWQLDIGGPT
jgi:hypothetical protein